MEKQIHLVSFNIPFPADYGGVIDVFHKLKALHLAGVKIKLHCFEYGRQHASELEKYCEKVYYYPRKKYLIKNLSLKPFIVQTRNHRDLLENLTADICPILFEGLHSCYFLNHPDLNHHKKIVRTHNIEHDYYRFLSQSAEKNIDKLFFRIESIKLKKYENILRHADELLCISPSDHQYFQQKYNKGIYIPAFHPFERVLTQEGKGEHILYHGNLEVAENLNVVNFLIDKVFSEITYPFIIAGKNAPQKLIDRVKKIPHVTLYSNVSEPAMNHLIGNSHICLIPTFQPTGLKLKLLESLFRGRHCVCNTTMVQSTGLENLCIVAETASEMIQAIEQLCEEDIETTIILKRKEVLENVFSNEKNAQKIVQLL